MVRWVVGSILHGVDPLSYFSFQPVLHDWCNKGRGICYPVCGMMHIKEPLLLIGKSSSCGGSGFPLSLSEWSFTICPTPYNRKIKRCWVCQYNISFLPYVSITIHKLLVVKHIYRHLQTFKTRHNVYNKLDQSDFQHRDLVFLQELSGYLWSVTKSVILHENHAAMDVSFNFPASSDPFIVVLDGKKYRPAAPWHGTACHGTPNHLVRRVFYCGYNISFVKTYRMAF